MPKIIIAIAVSLCGIAQQNAAAQVLEEMIVTARKVEESLQDVPISVTVMSGERLTEAVAQLDLEGVTIEHRRRERGGIGGLRFHVLLDDSGAHYRISTE